MQAAQRAIATLAGFLAAGHAAAGGPLAIDSNGEPFTWDTGAEIQYRTDGGRLSETVDNSDAIARVASMFDFWEDVLSASISYDHAGSIQDVGAFTDGDVSTAVEFNAVDGSCGNGVQSPIVFDEDGSLFEDLGQDPDVIGFAGPCAIDGSGRILSGIAVMNGLFQDGVTNVNNPELSSAAFDATFVHEFGHFSGLEHSQINVECVDGSCSPDDEAGLPTMFPFLVTEEQRTLSDDDVAWISKLYPSGGAATHGVISGTVFFTDGESQLQYANVVARRVDTGANEDRRFAASSVSGYRFRVCSPNPITNPLPEFCPPSGSLTPGHIGFFEIPVPPGNYMIEIEGIDPLFTGGSSVGPADFPLALPGAAPGPLGPITVGAGQTATGNDFILIGTPPRFDQFEGP